MFPLSFINEQETNSKYMWKNYTPRSGIELMYSAELYQYNVCFLFIFKSITTTPPMVTNGGHGIVPPSMGGRPPCGQAFAAPMVCSDCSRSSGGKRVEFLSVEEFYTQPVR